jgi:hypothetical protein
MGMKDSDKNQDGTKLEKAERKHDSVWELSIASGLENATSRCCHVSHIGGG